MQRPLDPSTSSNDFNKKAHLARVNIVLVNWNGVNDTIECLDSLFRLSANPPETEFSISICDNGSTDGSVEAIASWLAEKEAEYRVIGMNSPLPAFCHRFVTIIQSSENLGFAKANNYCCKLALEEGAATHFWLLNNDTVVEHDSLLHLVDCWKQMHAANRMPGLVAAKLLLYSQRSVIQAIGGVYNPLTGITTNIGAYQEDVGQFDDDFFDMSGMDCIIGASMFCGRSFLLEVGLMNEVFFLYFEENDWMIRSRAKGFQTGFAWKSKVYHKVGKTIGTNDDGNARSLLSDFFGLRNRLLFTWMHFRLYMPVIYAGFFVVFFRRLVRRQFFRIAMLLVIALFFPIITMDPTTKRIRFVNGKSK